MGGRFLTDKKIESFLEEEVRVLQLPCGRLQPVRTFKFIWGNYDLVLNHTSLTEPEIGSLVQFFVDKYNVDFGFALREVLGPLRRLANPVMERKLELLKRRRSMSAELKNQFSGGASGRIEPGEAKDPKPTTPLVFRRALGQSRRSPQ